MPDQPAKIWRADLALDENGRRACSTILSAEERRRAGRFLRREDGDRYIASHAALRLVLGRVLAADPAALRLRADASGKPELDGPWQGALHLNLSHSGRVALVGLSTTARIGVDVEHMRYIPDCLGLAKSHFAAAEVAALAALPAEAQQAAFYGCWTRKEAFVKALGLGLSFPFDRFVVAVPPSSPALISIDGSRDQAAHWSLHHLDPAPGHVAAAVVEAPNVRFEDLSLGEGWAARLSSSGEIL